MDLESKSDMAGTLQDLYKQKYFADFIINCNGEQIVAHRSVLASKSSYFAKLLNSKYKEAQSGEFELNDTELAVMKAVIQYIYTACYMLPSATPAAHAIWHAKIYAAADYYGVARLKDHALNQFGFLLEIDPPSSLAASGEIYGNEALQPLKKVLLEKSRIHLYYILHADSTEDEQVRARIAKNQVLIHEVPGLSQDLLMVIAPEAHSHRSSHWSTAGLGALYKCGQCKLFSYNSIDKYVDPLQCPECSKTLTNIYSQRSKESAMNSFGFPAWQ